MMMVYMYVCMCVWAALERRRDVWMTAIQRAATTTYFPAKHTRVRIQTLAS